jgi:hypothetical protein
VDAISSCEEAIIMLMNPYSLEINQISGFWLCNAKFVGFIIPES